MTLADQLTDLGLRHAGAHLDDIIDQATKKRWSPAQLLEHIADKESQERKRRSVERRLTRSRVGRFKPISDFDWKWPKQIDRIRSTRTVVTVPAPAATCVGDGRRASRARHA